MTGQERILFYFLLGILIVFATAGFIVQGISETLGGVWELQIHPARLLNDFTTVGEGAALVNAALVAAIGLFLIRVNGVRISGPTVAAVFTMLGFGLFGKTPLNIMPVIFGVYVSGRFMGKSFKEYILIALFGTALGPLVTMLAMELGLPVPLGLPVAVLGGLVTGILLPPIAMTMLRFHQGFNLYNIGMTAGFFAVFAAAIISAATGSVPSSKAWNTEPSLLLLWMMPVLSILLASAGVLLGGRKVFSEFVTILRMPGRLPSDFMDTASVGSGLLNMGIMGLLFWGYVLIVGGDLNGPILGGILTVIGFAAFGKHPRNVWPVVLGIVAAILLFGKDLAAAGPLLAVLFGTTLAPLAGEFGPVIGFVAGFLHLVMVERTGAWHLGINLYNNGFAGGLTATFLVAVIEWYRNNRETTWGSKKDGNSRSDIRKNP